MCESSEMAQNEKVYKTKTAFVWPGPCGDNILNWLKPLVTSPSSSSQVLDEAIQRLSLQWQTKIENTSQQTKLTQIQLVNKSCLFWPRTTVHVTSSYLCASNGGGIPGWWQSYIKNYRQVSCHSYVTATGGTSVQFISHPWSKGWSHTMDVLSLLTSVVCHSDWSLHTKFGPRADVVNPSHTWSSSPTSIGDCSLYNLLFQAIRLFPHDVTTAC